MLDSSQFANCSGVPCLTLLGEAVDELEKVNLVRDAPKQPPLRAPSALHASQCERDCYPEVNWPFKRAHHPVRSPA